MTKRSSKPRPRGFTLIEMVLVIGGVTAVLGLAGGLLHVLLRLDRYSRNYLNDSIAISRLGEQFRADVRRAAEASVSAIDTTAAAKLVLTAPADPTVTYTWEGTLLKREEKLEGKPTRFETYRVDRLSPIVFESRDGFVAVVAGRPPDDSSGAFRSKVRVEARLGKARGLSQDPEAKK